MKLKRQDKNDMVAILFDLIELGEKFEGIYNEEIEDEMYEEYLEPLEETGNSLKEMEERYEKEGLEENLDFIEEIQEIVKNYFLFAEEEVEEVLEKSLERLQSLKERVEKVEIDIYSDIPALPYRSVLSFEDAIKLKGLVIHLQKISERLEKQFSKKDEVARKRVVRRAKRELEKDENMLKGELEKCDAYCPSDAKMLPLFEQALDIIESFKDFVDGKGELDNINFLIEELSRAIAPLEEMLAGYGKELRLVGLVNYIKNTGEKLIHTHANMDGEEAENVIDEIYNFLEDDLQRIEGERNTYSIHGESEKIAIKILEYSREIVESYMEAIDGNDITPVKDAQDTLMAAVELLDDYQAVRRESRETGLAQYLIKAGKNIKIISSSDMKESEIESRLEGMLEKLLKDLQKMEENKKAYFVVDEEDAEDARQASFALKPVEQNMREVFDRSIEVINNYIEFIDGEREPELIKKSFKVALYIASILEETGHTIEDMQATSTQESGSSIIGEA